MLSRFRSGRQQKAILEGLARGQVDVVIGTHRLLQKDVVFRNLGLVIVDEEHRFGVRQKEALKKMRTEVDVLTLTATPIPRTLHMALLGIRDLSVIETPPQDRHAIETYIVPFDPDIVRGAIERELARGGQVFFVHNQVYDIGAVADRLRQIVPGARIAIAHGQMPEKALEKVMLEFVQGDHDVLLCTTIIESGLDIPNANTLIVNRADRFGLAQLYQLRGRVGRSERQAYAYLIVPPASAMTDEARARIEALERHTELGSGFQVASLDLELRGGGDLLGSEQSGTVASVGFDLFCHMLQDAVRQLRGEDVVADVEPDLNFDVEALLPEQYIDEVGVRLSLYKRLASADDEAEVQEIAAEMEDRFGPPPREAKNLVAQMRIKAELRRLRVLGCDASARSVTLHLRDDTPLDPAKVMALIQKKGSPYRMTPDMKLTRRFGDEQADGLQNAELVLRDLAGCLRS
jgi:transcription-repair coupling factor (superfamily II helicase)